MDALKSFVQPAPARSFAPALILLLLAAGLSLAPHSLWAQGSVEAGQAKAITCAACHGPDGNSVNPEWPSLAGQHASYIVSALRAYQAGTRSNVLMTGQALPLSEQDMLDLGAFFAAQKPAPRTADPALVSAGERLYRGGNKETGTPACIACHGPTGRGSLPAGWPALAGQHATYTAAQLLAYRSRERRSDGDTQMMRSVAATLSDDEIRAVSSYIEGLR